MDGHAKRFDDEVLRRLHEVALAAREVPAEAQPRRLQDALVSLVALDVLSTGTFTMPESFSSDYTPTPGPSS
jgi:mannose/cellobiose epimerase-like protein (N-acyl-D-glucosamine 2-epimerase family)